MASLAEAQAKLKAVEAKINMLESQFEEATAKKEALAKQVRGGWVGDREGGGKEEGRSVCGLMSIMPHRLASPKLLPLNSDFSPPHHFPLFPFTLPPPQVMDCTIKLHRADKLIGGLGGERIRWQATVEQMGRDMNNVVGDVVVAAGSIAYSGGGTGGRERAGEGGREVRWWR